MEKLAIKLCMTKDIGVHGNLFGGIMLAWLDEAAATWANSVCQNSNMVTVKIDEMIFKKPVKVGNQVVIYGEIKALGTSSITMYVEARRQDFYTQREEVVCHTDFKFVRIDSDGQSVPLSEEVLEEYKHLKEA